MKCNAPLSTKPKDVIKLETILFKRMLKNHEQSALHQLFSIKNITKWFFENNPNMKMDLKDDKELQRKYDIFYKKQEQKKKIKKKRKRKN